VLIAKDFVFVHVPKTGGKFIRKVCREHLDCRFESRDHTPWDRAPDLPIYSVIRNPWDWYVSWFHHHSRRDARRDAWRHPLWEKLFDSGRRNFAETVKAHCNPPPGMVWFDRARERGWDIYTSWFWRLAGSGAKEGRVEVGRFENLREDFIAFLERHNASTPDLIEAVRTAPAENPSERGRYQDYYDDELRDLVGHRARVIVDMFGYRFDE
jgi:hypothetical protein